MITDLNEQVESDIDETGTWESDDEDEETTSSLQIVQGDAEKGQN